VVALSSQIEIGAGVPDAIAVFQARGPNGVHVPLLRADDEKVSHEVRTPPVAAGESYRVRVGE
jgi:hypothetical protein